MFFFAAALCNFYQKHSIHRTNCLKKAVVSFQRRWCIIYRWLYPNHNNSDGISIKFFVSVIFKCWFIFKLMFHSDFVLVHFFFWGNKYIQKLPHKIIIEITRKLLQHLNLRVVHKKQATLGNSQLISQLIDDDKKKYISDRWSINLLLLLKRVIIVISFLANRVRT